jgi:hypothetical protein
MTIPAALVAHDTRLWTGSFEDTYPDGFLQNLGTAPSEDGVYNWQVPVYDTSPSYFSPYASNTQINSYPEWGGGGAPPPPPPPPPAPPPPPPPRPGAMGRARWSPRVGGVHVHLVHR